MRHTFTAMGLLPDRMTFHMAIRHYFTTVAGYENLLEKERVDMIWPDEAEFGSEAFSQGVRSNEEAVRQANCRYISGIDDGARCATLVVELDGRIFMDRECDMSKDWGETTDSYINFCLPTVHSIGVHIDCLARHV